MSKENSEPKNAKVQCTITDDEIVTERKLPRRSFLGTGGALIAGVVGIASAARASAQDDPDKRPDDQRKPDDKSKSRPEDRPKTDDKARQENRRRSDDKSKPEDRPKQDDQPR